MSKKREFWVIASPSFGELTSEFDESEARKLYEFEKSLNESATITHVIEYSAYTEATSRAEKAERKLAKAREIYGRLTEQYASDEAICDEDVEDAVASWFRDYDSELEAVEGE